MCEKCNSKFRTANPPPYPGDQPAKRKGPMKRLLKGLNAFLHGKRRNSEPKHRKRLVEASIIQSKAGFKCNEAERKMGMAMLKAHYAQVEIHSAEKRSLEASLKADEALGKLTTPASKGRATALQSVNAKLKHEESKRVWIEAELKVLEVQVGALEAAIAYDEIELEGL